MTAEVTSSTVQSLGREKGKSVHGTHVDEILQVFESLGYEVSINSKLEGTTGVEHPFDIIARRDSETIVVDLISFRASILDTPASDVEVVAQIQLAGIQIRAKGWDCKVYESFIVYLSSCLSASDANGLLVGEHDPFELFLKQNHISTVRSANIKEAAERLRTHLSPAEVNLVS